MWGKAVGLLLLQLAANAGAEEQKINQKDEYRQVCSGMYSRKAWGGNVDPFILTKFNKPGNIQGDPLVSMVLFEWKDRRLVGRPDESQDYDFFENRHFLCDKPSKDGGLCDELGSFILAANASESSTSQIISEAVHLKDASAIQYKVKHTGYYCVGTYAYDGHDYDGIVEFRNAFGHLPAAQVAKMPFYSASTLVYAFVALAWGALYWLHRQDILPVQNYITAVLVFLVVEMFMTWLFYDFQNRHGLNVGAKALLVVTSVLSAARNSLSFFLLLIVCMGYGVVKPTLGKTMTYVRWLTIAHFVFGVVYAIASLSLDPEDAGLLTLFIVLPLAATLTTFYVWTLNSLTATMKDLLERKQTIKAAMYRRLWFCIVASIIAIFGFFVVTSWTLAGQTDADIIATNWKGRWFILDGWLNLVLFFDMAFVAYVWRPTANNRRFAMSDEIAQDDDGFEIASMRDSMDLDSDLEGNEPHKSDGQAEQDGDHAPPAANNFANARRDVSPLPAPVPQKPVPIPRESLERETIFAVGEGGESDESDDERERLTGTKND